MHLSVLLSQSNEEVKTEREKGRTPSWVTQVRSDWLVLGPATTAHQMAEAKNKNCCQSHLNTSKNNGNNGSMIAY